jgi:drug/metabolite transporter (DMT)-like permease
MTKSLSEILKRILQRQKKHYIILNTNPLNNSTKAHLALLISQIIYAITFVIAKILTQYTIGPYALVMLRVLGVIPLLWLTDLLFIREKTDRKDIPMMMLLAVFGVTINQSLFIKGLSLTSPISASIMMITTPILVIIVAGFLIKEKITWLRLTGIIIGFAGAAMLMISSGIHSGSRADNPIGDLFIFINALSWGTYLVLVKPVMKKYHTVTILRWIFTFSAIVIVPIGFRQFQEVQWSSLSSQSIFYLFFIVFFTTYIAYLLNVYALNALSPAVVSAYIYLQPLLTAVIAIGSGNDSLNWMKVFSALLIFAGVYLVSMRSKVKLEQTVE